MILSNNHCTGICIMWIHDSKSNPRLDRQPSFYNIGYNCSSRRKVIPPENSKPFNVSLTSNLDGKPQFARLFNSHYHPKI